MKETLLFFVGILWMVYGVGFMSSCSDDKEEFSSSVTGIQLNTSKLELVEWDKDTLVAQLLPDNASYASVIWNSDADSIATVNDFGVVRAVKEGKAVITARVFGKNLSVECVVSVVRRPIPVDRLVLDADSVMLTCLDGKWDKLKLNAIVSPENADMELLWTTSDEGVATVSPEGLVTAIGQGEALIRCVVANDERRRDSCKVRVIREKGVTNVEILDVENGVSLKEGNVKELVAEVLPLNAEDKTVVWTSSDPSVVAIEPVDQLTAKITALKEGEAIVTVQSNDGGITDRCKVRVASNKVTALSGLQKTLTSVVGKSEALSVVATPEDANDKTILWTSSDESVAMVQANNDSQKATVTCLKEGTVTITATAKSNPEATISCTITVKPSIAVTGLTGLAATLSGTAGQSGGLSVNLNPSGASNKTVLWISSDKSVATVEPGSDSRKATVKYLKEGTAIITATSEDNPGATMSCSVKVNKAGHVAVKSFISTPFKDNKTVSVGQKVVWQVSPFPYNATNQNVHWEISDESIGELKVRTQSYIVDITWKKAGKVTLKATSEDNPSVQWVGEVIVE